MARGQGRDGSHAAQQKQACLLCNNCAIMLQCGRQSPHGEGEGEGPAGDSGHPRGSVTGPVATGRKTECSSMSQTQKELRQMLRSAPSQEAIPPRQPSL